MAPRAFASGLARRSALKMRLPLLIRAAMYALRGGFPVRPLLISLALGVTGMILSSLEESFPHPIFPVAPG